MIVHQYCGMQEEIARRDTSEICVTCMTLYISTSSKVHNYIFLFLELPSASHQMHEKYQIKIRNLSPKIRGLKKNHLLN